MRAVQRHTDKPESQPTTTGLVPVQRRDALQGLDYDTAVQRLAPVQAKEDTANVHAAAQRGTSGGGGSLPYLGQIQKSFGSHDVSGIKSHTGGKASEACESMGAEAYASGQDVAFKGQPDLHTAAHEAAHIVQQRAGVQLSGGVGKAGDPYEKNADEVADRVVQGKSAEDLLGGPSFGGAAAVQRSVQMKGGLLDKLKSFFLEAKLTGPQQQVAKILAEKHGVDVSGLPTATFASLYKDAGGDNPKQSPEKTAANMASAARDHVGDKKPTQRKESGVVSGVAIQRKEARHVQRLKARPVQRSSEEGTDEAALSAIPEVAEPEAMPPAEIEALEQESEEATDAASTVAAEPDVDIQPLIDQVVQMKGTQSAKKPAPKKPAPKKPAPKKPAPKKPAPKKPAPKTNDSGAAKGAKTQKAIEIGAMVKKFATQGAIEKDIQLPMATGPFPYVPGAQMGMGWGGHIKLVFDQKRLFALAANIVAGKAQAKFDGAIAATYLKSVNLGGRLRLRVGPIGLFDSYGVEGSIGFQTVAQIDGRQGKRIHVSGVLQGTLNAKADVGLLSAFVGEHLEKEWLLDLARGKFIIDLGKLSASKVVSIEVRRQGNHWQKLGASNVRSALARKEEIRRRMAQNAKETEGMSTSQKITRNLTRLRGQ